MFYYFRPHQCDPATLIFFHSGWSSHSGPSESKWATRLSLTNFWHNKKTLDEMLADDLRKRRDPDSIYYTIRQKDTSCSSLDCFLFPFLFLSRLRPKRINEHWEEEEKKRKKNFERQPVFLLSALYSVFRCETRVEKEQKPSTEFSFIFPSKNKMSWIHQLDKKIRNKFGNWIVDSSKCLIEKEKGSIQLNSGELEDLTEWKIAPFHHVTAGPPTEPPLYYHYRIMYT